MGGADATWRMRVSPAHMIHAPLSPSLSSASSGFPAPSEPRTESSTLSDPSPEGARGCHVPPVGVFWDIENCCLPADVSAEDVGANVRRALREHPATRGCPVTVFSAYADFSLLRPRTRAGCQRTGINLVDVPHCGKDAADIAILADLFLFALDNPPPCTILLISTDVDFAHALQKLALRQYRILLAVLGAGTPSRFLTSAAEHVWDWRAMAMGLGAQPVKAGAAQREPHSWIPPEATPLDTSLDSSTVLDEEDWWENGFSALYN